MDIPKEIMQGKDWEKVPSSGNWHMINKNGWKKCSIRILNAKWLSICAIVSSSAEFQIWNLTNGQGAYIRFLCPREINGKASLNARRITVFPTAISSRLDRISF